MEALTRCRLQIPVGSALMKSSETTNPNMQCGRDHEAAVQFPSSVHGSGEACGLVSTSFALREDLDNLEHRPPLCGALEESPGLRGRSGPSSRAFLRRTPTGILRNCSAGFKSPIQSPRACQSEGASKEALQRDVEELKEKDLALDQEIAQLLAEGYNLEELDRHISLLHEYNDIKDTGQMLLGKLATLRGMTTKELYPKFDLELTD